MLNILNSFYMVFALLAQTEDHGNQSTKKLILSLAVAFLAPQTAVARSVPDDGAGGRCAAAALDPAQASGDSAPAPRASRSRAQVPALVLRRR